MARSGSIPADELAAADLQAHPVWQFRTQAEGDPGVDESHVAPKAGALTLGTFGSHLVAATYDLSNGVRLPGSVQVDVLGQKVHFTPAVVYAQGKSVDPLAHDAEQRLSRITKTSNARPSHWELAVVFHGEERARSGRIARSTIGTALALLFRLVLLRFSRRRQ